MVDGNTKTGAFLFKPLGMDAFHKQLPLTYSNLIPQATLFDGGTVRSHPLVRNKPNAGIKPLTEKKNASHLPGCTLSPQFSEMSSKPSALAQITLRRWFFEHHVFHGQA
jgi:hypothetical protein